MGARQLHGPRCHGAAPPAALAGHTLTPAQGGRKSAHRQHTTNPPSNVPSFDGLAPALPLPAPPLPAPAPKTVGLSTWPWGKKGAGPWTWSPSMKVAGGWPPLLQAMTHWAQWLCWPCIFRSMGCSGEGWSGAHAIPRCQGVVPAVRRAEGRECPGGLSLLLPTQRALLAHRGLGASWGGSGAMGIQHGADKLAWLWGCMGWTAPVEAHPPQGWSWVFLQMRTKKVMLVSRQHVQLRCSRPWWEAGGEGARLRCRSAAMEASSGYPSSHDRGRLQRQPWQGWQHKGPNLILYPWRYPSGETTDYRWCLIAHKTASWASNCADTQASHHSLACHRPQRPGPIGSSPPLGSTFPAMNAGHGPSAIAWWCLRLTPPPIPNFTKTGFYELMSCGAL